MRRSFELACAWMILSLFAGCSQSEPPSEPSPAGEEAPATRIGFEGAESKLRALEPFDVSEDTARIQLSLRTPMLPSGVEEMTFTKDGFDRMADGTIVWSGKSIHANDASALYVTKDGDASFIKLVKGDFEYDIHSTGIQDYELRVLDATHTSPMEYVADGDAASSDEPLAFTPMVTAAVPPPFDVTVNLAYTPKAITHFSSVTDLKLQFANGLKRINDSLRNSKINARVVLGRVARVDYAENDTMKLVRDDVEAGLVSGLPVPSGKNKTVLVADVFGKWSGTAMLGGPYIVIKWPFISTNLLAHEVGHSFNCVHERAFQFANGRYTQMIQDGSLGREPIYSNPNARWLNQSAGTTYHFNAKRICEHFRLGVGCWLP